MLFLEYMEQPDKQTRMSFVQDFGLLRNTQPGPLTMTGNPLDLALRGEGYFTVETLSGPRYTRAGNLQLNANRELVDINGLPVLSDNDQRIVIPDNAADIKIMGDGTITTENGPVAKLKVVNFDDEQKLQELGGGLYATDQEPRPVEQPLLTQGAIEGSNVQPIVESTQMMEVLRAYQSTQKLIDSEHERMRTAIRQLARVQ